MPEHRKRLRRIEHPNHVRYLTFSCFRRLPLFNNDSIKDAFMHQLASARIRTRFKLHAWVVMPEHVHLLIWPALPGFPVSKVAWVLKRDFARFMIARWKAREARILEKIRASDGSLRFWQPGGGYDRNILATDELPEKIRYIHNNPVRRGLVNHPIDWAWSSARWYAGERDGQLSIDEVRRPEPS